MDLAPALNVEALQPLLSNPEFLKKVKDFLPHGEKDEGKEITAEDLRGTVQSPQFQQALQEGADAEAKTEDKPEDMALD